MSFKYGSYVSKKICEIGKETYVKLQKKLTSYLNIFLGYLG